MSKIKNGGLEQYGAEPVEQQQFGTAGVEGVKQLGKYNFYRLTLHAKAQYITSSHHRGR